MDVAGSGRSLGPDAVQLLDVYLDLLEIDDEYIRPSVLDSLSNLGVVATPALPKLYELAAQGGGYEASIKDTIYYIARQGEKPDGYDRQMEYYNTALKEAGCVRLVPNQSSP